MMASVVWAISPTLMLLGLKIYKILTCMCIWFQVLKVYNQQPSPMYHLRSAIQQFAKQHNIDLNTTGESDDDDVKRGDSAALDIENPADCIGLHCVSLYDIEGL